MELVLLIEEPQVDAMLRRLHAELGRLRWGWADWLRFLRRLPASNLRFEVYAPQAAEARVRKFLRAHVAFTRGAAPMPEYRFVATESQHVVKVFRRTADEPSARPGWLRRISGGRGAPTEELRSGIRRELHRAVDALIAPGEPPPDNADLQIHLLDDAGEWLPHARALESELLARARERLRIFHGQDGTSLRMHISIPDGTQPLGGPDEAVRVCWKARPSAESERPAATEQRPSAREDRHPAAREPDSLPPAREWQDLTLDLEDDATLPPEAGAARIAAHDGWFLEIRGPAGARRFALPRGSTINLGREEFGSALLAVGSDPRVLSREGARCTVIRREPDGVFVLERCAPGLVAGDGVPAEPGPLTPPRQFRLGTAPTLVLSVVRA